MRLHARDCRESAGDSLLSVRALLAFVGVCVVGFGAALVPAARSDASGCPVASTAKVTSVLGPNRWTATYGFFPHGTQAPKDSAPVTICTFSGVPTTGSFALAGLTVYWGGPATGTAEQSICKEPGQYGRPIAVRRLALGAFHGLICDLQTPDLRLDARSLAVAGPRHGLAVTQVVLYGNERVSPRARLRVLAARILAAKQ
jgi:hypothetical protein